MFNDARASGLVLFVREGYRTFQDQQQIMNESGNMKIKEIQNDGQQKWQKNTWQFQERVSISWD